MTKQTRKEPQTTIAVNQSAIKELDNYLSDKNLSRKEFVEKAISYFVRTGFDLNDNISSVTPLQNAVEDLKALQKEQSNQNNAVMTLLQNIALAQSKAVKALPNKGEVTKLSEELATYKHKYTQAKQELTKMSANKFHVSPNRIKDLLSKVFDI